MSQAESGAPKGGMFKWAMIALAAVGVVAVLYVIASASFNSGGGSKGLTGLNTGAMEKLMIADKGKPAPDAVFFDGEGRPVKLSDFKGQVVVMNLWATWCAPCRKELPSLGKLAAAYEGKPVKVLAISVDKAEMVVPVRAILATAPPLKEYRDPKYLLSFGLNPQSPGFPTTVIFGKDGVETARVQGDADWNSPQARAVIDRLLSE